MPVWLTQLGVVLAMGGAIGFCFWKARGVKPRKGNSDGLEAYDPTNHQF
jgi:hypothetical protein